MAGNLSGPGEALVITALTTGLYVSLHTGAPGNTGANEVPSTNGYIRVATGTWSNAGANPTVASNTGILNFATATPSGWGMITNFGYWDAATGGNFRGGTTVATTKTVNAGDTARFIAGALTISVD